MMALIKCDDLVLAKWHMIFVVVGVVVVVVVVFPLQLPVPGHIIACTELGESRGWSADTNQMMPCSFSITFSAFSSLGLGHIVYSLDTVAH